MHLLQNFVRQQCTNLIIYRYNQFYLASNALLLSGFGQATIRYWGYDERCEQATTSIVIQVTEDQVSSVIIWAKLFTRSLNSILTGSYYIVRIYI